MVERRNRKIKQVYNKKAGRRNRGFGKTKSEAKAPQNYSDARPLKCIKVKPRNAPAYTYCNKNLRENIKNEGSAKAGMAKSKRIAKQEKQQRKGEAKPAIKVDDGRKKIGTFLSKEQPKLAPARRGRPPKGQGKGLSVRLRVGGEIVAPKKRKVIKRAKDALPKRKLNKDGTPRKVRADKGKKRK